MIWKYNDDYRDDFSKGPHRDILIVPHATNVTPVQGGPPIVTSKRPVFDWDETTEKYYPRKENGHFVMDDVDWVIDNSVLVKEKFNYHYSLNSEQNLTFSACNAAMVKFTIRNKKEYVEEEDEHGEPTGNHYWEQEIPNLYKQEFTMKNPNGTERIVTGEVLSHACIKVYTYINGDSSTLLYLGMFTVEEDRLVDNGYNREITAYDFLATFRDMDVFNWYQNLFKGINKLDNQFEDATNESGEEQTKPEDYDSPKNWVREPREKWTIKEALVDLFDNLAAYDLCVWEEIDVKDEDGHSTGETKKVMTKGMTVSNPNEYGRDGYPEGNGYSGFGMPIMLDPDILTKGTKRYIPTDPGDDEYERYGYMDILELEFYQNPKIMKSESLSLGKVLEDIGILAGRYPYIRLDQLDDNDYFDPAVIPSEGEHAYDSRYNNYERCILTFKPLPSSKDDSDVSKSPDMVFSNHEITKGFQHEYCDVEDVMIFKIPLDDGTEISYQRLTKEQRVAASKSLLQTFTMPNNMFASYLVTKSDDDEIKGMLDKYKKIREDLFGTETSNGNMSSGAKFQQGYLDMKYRTYIPYQLTTYADPVRECGDRILINFEDKITGEIMTFYSYILERDISGIQKMMDTYTANGNVKNPVFGNYRSGLKNNAGNQNKQNSDSNNMTPFDLIEYMRNCGYRLLDEPTECSAVFCKGGESIEAGNVQWYRQIRPVPAEDDDYYLVTHEYFNNDTSINPINIYRYDYELDELVDCGTYEAQDYDMVCEIEYPEDPWYSDIYWVFYQGRWYQIKPGNVIYESDNTREEPSVSYKIYEWNEYINAPDAATYAMTYDTIHVDGQAISFNTYGDIISTNGGYENSIYFPPGISSCLDLSGGDLGLGTLTDIIEYPYLGTANLSASGGTANIQDGDTSNKLIISNELVLANELDRVTSNYKKFIYYDGKWWSIDNRLNTIVNYTSSEVTCPELDEIMKFPDDDGRYHNRIIGLDVNKLTINGVSTDVQVFDRIVAAQYYGTYVYTPSHVWADVESLTDADDTYVPVRGGASSQVQKYVSLKWSDPQDITDYKPTPATWEGTVIIRKENSAPLHRWDGEKIVRTTTRDKYKTDPYKDEDIEANKVYYYGFFPYYIKIADPEHPIRFYTFTKVIRVETGIITYSPTIDEIDIDRNNVTIFYTITIPVDVTYTSIKLYGKKGEIPACDDTDDIIEDIDPDDESITLSDLDYTQYYFTIKCIDSNEAEVSSNTEMADLGFAWDGSEVDIVWSGETNKMSVQIQNSSILFKMYIGSTNIYSFTSPVGSEPSDVKYINVEFLQDTTNEIAKPSFIYKDGTNYMYNQESPTEAQMQDIYVWLQGRAIVPPEYRSYIDTINGTGFFFRDWPQVHNDDWNIDYYPHYPLYIHSYKSYGGSVDFNSGSPWIEETSKGIASLYITEQQTGWGYDTTFEAYDWVYWAVTPDKRTQVGLINKTNQSIGGRSGSSYGWDTNATHNRTDTTGHGYESLSALFYDITRLYRNVNIYVNGELWSKVD